MRCYLVVLLLMIALPAQATVEWVSSTSALPATAGSAISVTLANADVNNTTVIAFLLVKTSSDLIVTVPSGWNSTPLTHATSADGIQLFLYVSSTSPRPSTGANTWGFNLTAEAILYTYSYMDTAAPGQPLPVNISGSAPLTCTSSGCTVAGVTTTATNVALQVFLGLPLVAAGVPAPPGAVSPGSDLSESGASMNVADLANVSAANWQLNCTVAPCVVPTNDYTVGSPGTGNKLITMTNMNGQNAVGAIIALAPFNGPTAVPTATKTPTSPPPTNTPNVTPTPLPTWPGGTPPRCSEKSNP